MNGEVDQLSYLRSSAIEGWGALATALCDEILSDAWGKFTASDRRFVHQVLHPYLQAWCNPMPPATGALVIRSLEDGQLNVNAALAGWTDHRLQFRSGDYVTVDHVINTARRASDSVSKMDSSLMRSMVMTGLAAPDPFGGVKVENGTWRIRSRVGEPQNIYAIGGLAQGARYYVNALDSIVRSVEDVIEQVSP